MKPGIPPTLSQHLLSEASKFFRYPKRKRRTKATLEAIEWLDEQLTKFVEQRRTFVLNVKSLGKGFSDPIFLDELYCRYLLRVVPRMVQRTRALAELALPKSADTEALVYLRESASCLIFGLSQAAVALARAAVEASLRKVYANVPGNTAHALQDTTLDPLISNLSTLFDRTKGRAGLSPEAERSAREVQRAGNDVLHHRRLIDAEEALKVFEAARLVIRSVAGG
jgi:Domain of unknown function (DUF4145)